MKNLNPLIDKLIAHRGIHNKYVRENSLLAIEKAVQKNHPVEIDVILTKDKKIILFHDLIIKNTNNQEFFISDLTFEQIKRINSYIPTLEEVLNFISGKVPLLIELKPYNKVPCLEKEIVKYLDKYQGYFAIQSFNPLSVYWFKKHRKNYIRGQLLTANYRYNIFTNFLYKHIIFNKFTSPNFISYNIKGLPNQKIEKIRENIIILGWTIKNKEQLLKYRKYCDNFIVENVIIM